MSTNLADNLVTTEKKSDIKQWSQKGIMPGTFYQYNDSIREYTVDLFSVCWFVCFDERPWTMVGFFLFPFIWDWYVRVKLLELSAFSKGQILKTLVVPQKFTCLSQNHQKLAQLFLRAHPLISPDPTQIQRWISNLTSKKRRNRLCEQKDTKETLLGRLKRKWVQPCALVSLTHLLFMARRRNYSSLQ